MDQLYNKTCLECSKLVTNRYSTSFSLGIKVFEKKLRNPIYAIYGFVRFADEIVDTFHDSDKKSLLAKFRKDTHEAIAERLSLNPILNAFQLVVNEYGITAELIDAFLDSMSMDLYNVDYDRSGYEKYIYGSAEVVGLMCLKVFCHNDPDQYEKLKPSAKSLGSAFQKINFLRDIKSDYDERGRVYFPGIKYESFTNQQKEQIEADIKMDFDHALEGIKQLPNGAKLGVYLAYKYYLNLFAKIKKAPAQKVKEERIRVKDSKKAYLLAKSALKWQLRLI